MYARSRFLTFVLFLLLASAPSVRAETWLMSAEAGVWFPGFDGSVRGGTISVPGTNLDLGTTLGVEDNAAAPMGRIVLRPLSSHRFILDYAQASFDGNRTLSQNFTYDGRTYSAATTVRSAIDVMVAGLDYRYSLWKSGGVELGLGAGVRFIGVGTRISEATAGSIDEQIAFPVPVIGGDIRYAVTDRLSLEAELAGLSVDISGNKASFFDGRAAFRYEIGGTIGLMAGYRYVGLDVSADGDAADITLDGPFASLAASF